jgi:hypothetical protein
MVLGRNFLGFVDELVKETKGIDWTVGYFSISFSFRWQALEAQHS